MVASRTASIFGAVALFTTVVLGGASTAAAEPVLCARGSRMKIRDTTCKKKESLLGPLLQGGQDPVDADLLDGLDSSDFLAVDEKAADADLLDGRDASDFLPTTGLPSGATLTGAWGGRHPNPDFGFETVSYLLSVSFPVPAAVGLLAEEVNFAPNTSGVPSEADPECTGNVEHPTAPPGKVCIYLSEVGHVDSLGGFALSKLPGGRDMDRFGFLVRVIGSKGANERMLTAMGTWAYTAP